MQNPKKPSRCQQFLNGGGDFFMILFGGIGVCVLFAILTSCKQVEYVTVPEVHTEYRHSTDTVRQVDSIIDHQTTVICEVDSATMAQYGIRLENAQRAWLIQNERLMREIQQLRESKADTLIVHDSIPYPVPVKEYIKETPTLIKGLAWMGGIGLLILIAILILKLKKIF